MENYQSETEVTIEHGRWRIQYVTVDNHRGKRNEYIFHLALTFTDCPWGTYGIDCSERCSNACKRHLCNATTGHCLDGCSSTGKTGSFCDQSEYVYCKILFSLGTNFR